MNVMTFRPFRYTNPVLGFIRGQGKGLEACRRSGDAEVSATWNPVADIFEHDDAYVLKLETPGVSRSDIEIEFCENSLIIKGERKEDEAKGQTYHLYESMRGKFVRSFLLPRQVDVKNIAATLNNGILEVRVPKAEEVKPRTIDIK